MTNPEFSRPRAAADIGTTTRRHEISATSEERAALTDRFDLLALDDLSASFDLRREAAGIRVTGRIRATGAQPCVATGEPVPFTHDEPVALLLTEALPAGDEIELAEADLDVEPFTGGVIDLGEIAAQALGVALDPYPRCAEAAPGVISEDEARERSSPFAVLKGKT